MIKNQANIYQFVLWDMVGQGMTGLSPTVRIRKDTGSFAATTNTPTEVGYGLYEVALTATECNCDIMAIEVSLPDGQFPAILTNEYLTSSSDLSSFTQLVESAILHWTTEGNTLTLYNSSDTAIGTYTLTRDSKGVITAIEPAE